MTTDRIPLEGARAIAFHGAFEQRHDYIRAELIHHLIDGEDRVPLPGCPECGKPAEQVDWYMYDVSIEVDADPCGHRFRVERPVTETITGSDGSVLVREWTP